MASPRYPPIDPSSIKSSEQRDAYNDMSGIMDKHFSKLPFTYKRQEDNALYGPHAIFLHTPGYAQGMVHLFNELVKLPGTTPAVREIVDMTMAAHFQCKFITYCHTRISSVPAVGLKPEHIKAFAFGHCPDDAEEWERVAYDVAKQLASVPGPLPDALFKRAVEAFGQQGTLTLIHYARAYAWMSIVMNGADTQLPPGEDLLPQL